MKTNKMNKFTKEQVEFILENYLNSPERCVKVTNHSLASIKMLLRGILYNYTDGKEGLKGGQLSNGKPREATLIADEYRAKYGMSKGLWIAKFI